jgi:hypothetical protein
MAPVLGLGNFGRRAIESVVGMFALLGFLYVPLGRHTGFEHAKAVLSTPAAAAAIEDLSAAALDLRQRAFDLFTGHVTPPAPPPEAAARVPKPRGNEPRAVPPKLK